MAKQRGTHQISGTINNLVYYQQKYVKGGLIRRQNEAMAVRLRIDPVFRNTRDASALFGGCMMVASALQGFASRRIDVMTKPSRNAHLTASLLRMYQAVHGTLKNNTIDLLEFNAPSLIEATDRLMKTPLSKFFSSVNRVYNGVSVGSNIDFYLRSTDLETYARVCGVSVLQIEFHGPFFIDPINKNETSQKYSAPSVSGNRVVGSYTWTKDEGDFSISLTAPEYTNNRGFVFCTIMPVISGYGMLARFKIQNAIGFYLIVDYD